jgi:EAL domain-containing protein (putative c-di-GMP-specific phosphodiesterase class I)
VRDADGVRLLSQRPSVLAKVQRLITGEDGAGGDVELAGPGWQATLKDVLRALSNNEGEALWAVRLGDPQSLPLPAAKVLAQARTDWFPEFLSFGRMLPHFQPIVDLQSGEVVGREALIRGKLAAVELRGGELMAAAEAHDALFSFDSRARSAALSVGLALLPPGETLFVNLDPRSVLDVTHSVLSTWPAVKRSGGDPRRVCIELVRAERCRDRDLLVELTAAHREQGARIAVDDLSGGVESLDCLEAVRPDVAKLDTDFVDRVEQSVSQRRLVAALVECAHELGCKVVAEGVERVTQFEAVRALGVDFGQGYYFGHPTERPMAVDARLVRGRVYV